MAEVNSTLLMQRLVILLDKQNREAESVAKGGGPPPTDGNLDSRVAKLEASAEAIQRDTHEIKDDLRTLLKSGLAAFIITWGGIIAVALGLALVMAKGFKWIS